MGKMVENLIKSLGSNYEKILEKEEIWKKKYSTYKLREEQLQIAANVREAFNSGKVVCIEGPTSVGKTIAYLLCAILYANTQKERVFVSTNTKGLQSQLIDEIENLIDILELRGKFKYGILKGRNNYLCVEKVKDLYEDIMGDSLSYSNEEKLAILYLKRLCESNKCCTIDDINYWAKSNFIAIHKFIPLINCESRECHGEKCTYEDKCLYINHLKTLKESNLTIINHSLMLMWPYGTMKDRNNDDITLKNVIIDEAHNLPDNCYNSFASELDETIMEEQIEISKGTFIRAVTKYMRYGKFTESTDTNIIKQLDDILITSKEIKSHVSFILKDTIYNYNEEITKEWCEKNDLIVDKFLALLNKIRTFNKNARRICDELGNLEGVKNKDALKSLEEWLMDTNEWQEILSRAFVEDKSIDYCYNIEFNNKNGSWIVRIIALDISKIFNNRIIDGLNAGVFISATLTADNKNMNYFKNTLGINFLEKPRTMNDLIVKGAIDKKARRMVVIPKDIPKTPQSLDINNVSLEEYIDTVSQNIKDVVLMLNGHALVLFPNKLRMDMIIDKIEDDLNQSGIEIYREKQGLEVLKDSMNKCVCFGSKGFYEGIDIPGDGLVAVILEKVPHKYQRAPLYKAMERRFVSLNNSNDERNFFNKVLYPSVLTEMRQIEGRLLRTTKDFGFFIVLNGLNSNHYKSAGKFFSDMDVDRRKEVFFQNRNDMLKSIKSKSEDWIVDIVEKVFKENGNNIKEILFDKSMSFYENEHSKKSREIGELLDSEIKKLKMSGFNLNVSILKEENIYRVEVKVNHTVLGNHEIKKVFRAKVK